MSLSAQTLKSTQPPRSPVSRTMLPSSSDLMPGRFLWPGQPQRLPTCLAGASRRRIRRVAHSQQVRLQLGGGPGKADIDVSVPFRPRGELHLGRQRLQRVRKPFRRSEQRDLESRLHAELRHRWFAPHVVIGNHRVLDRPRDGLWQRRLDPAPRRERRVGKQQPGLLDLLRFAVHEHDRQMPRRLRAPQRVRNLAAVRRHPRQIDHHRIGRTRLESGAARRRRRRNQRPPQNQEPRAAAAARGPRLRSNEPGELSSSSCWPVGLSAC